MKTSIAELIRTAAGVAQSEDQITKDELRQLNEFADTLTPGAVLQSWVYELSLMQQSVIITACRGPDTLHKNHIAKRLCRWLRRCFLLSAFDKCVIYNPHDERGGSFTGRSTCDEYPTMDAVLDAYLKCVDEVPHHFHLHLMHAAEILGYKHPIPDTRAWWHQTYVRLAKDMHLNPETVEQMDTRLGDNREDWLAAEEVTADA